MMKHLYTTLLRTGVLATALLVALGARAQAPAWNLATRLGPPNNINTAHTIYHTVADAQGNLIVAGIFQGQFTLGSTTLTSAGATDAFIAKYVPATDTWAWAYRGGGRDFDAYSDVAVSGNTIYVVGNISNSLTNANLVALGSAGSSSASGVRVLGARPAGSPAPTFCWPSTPITAPRLRSTGRKWEVAPWPTTPAG